MKDTFTLSEILKGTIIIVLILLPFVMINAYIIVKWGVKTIEKERIKEMEFEVKLSSLKEFVKDPTVPKEFVINLFAEMSKDPLSHAPGNYETLSFLEDEFYRANSIKEESYV